MHYVVLVHLPLDDARHLRETGYTTLYYGYRTTDRKYMSKLKHKTNSKKQTRPLVCILMQKAPIGIAKFGYTPGSTIDLSNTYLGHCNDAMH